MNLNLNWILHKYNEPFIFYSPFFIYFLVFFFFIWGIRQIKPNWNIPILLLFSIYFFYKVSGNSIWIALTSAIINYFISLLVNRIKPWGLVFLIIGLSINLALLIAYKIIQTIPSSIILPIGVSFYSFENISYLVDTYTGKIKAKTSIGNYMAFIFFFPKLIMGPILRASDFFVQFQKSSHPTASQIGMGTYLITTGLLKKVFIADYLNAAIVQPIFDSPIQHAGVEYLLALYGYAFVIYCDFSGYSSIAIGIAKWMGLNLSANFNSPYLAKNPSDFWRRWHISLSQWFRDYLYIPLGGNKVSKWRMLINLLITMVFCGLWHGFKANFILWGIFHAFLLAVWGKHNLKGKITILFQRFLLFQLICLGWVFFRNESLSTAIFFLEQCFKNWSIPVLTQFCTQYYKVLMILLLAIITHLLPSSLKTNFGDFLGKLPFVSQAAILFLIIWLIEHYQFAPSLTPIYLQF